MKFKKRNKIEKNLKFFSKHIFTIISIIEERENGKELFLLMIESWKITFEKTLSEKSLNHLNEIIYYIKLDIYHDLLLSW